MKQGKNPTAAQKRWLQCEGYNSKEWLAMSWDAMKAVIQHKHTKEQKTIEMYE